VCGGGVVVIARHNRLLEIAFANQGAHCKTNKHFSEEFGSSIGNVLYLGDGSLHPVVLYDSRELRAYAKAIAAPEENICSRVEFGGALTVEHGVGMRKNELKTLMNLHRSGFRLDEAPSGRRIVAESWKDFFAEQRVGRFA
jgi:FAD/FMN-containing dehydrogenase